MAMQPAQTKKIMCKGKIASATRMSNIKGYFNTKLVIGFETFYPKYGLSVNVYTRSCNIIYKYMKK